jgi:hypothetical protein
LCLLISARLRSPEHEVHLMNAFSAAIDLLFADPNLARDAAYVSAHGNTLPVRIIARRADSVTDFANARLWSQTASFDVRTSEVAAPAEGDIIEMNGAVYVIQSDLQPLLEAELRGADRAVTAGFGQRLANTWRSRTYPEGEQSLGAAGLVWSKAPNLIRLRRRRDHPLETGPLSRHPKAGSRALRRPPAKDHPQTIPRALIALLLAIIAYLLVNPVGLQ